MERVKAKCRDATELTVYDTKYRETTHDDKNLALILAFTKYLLTSLKQQKM